MFEIFLFRKLDLAMIAEEPNEAEKEKNDKNERQKTPPSDVPPRMDKYDRLNSSSTLKQCFFPWPKQLDQVSLLKPVSFVFVHVDENVATAIMRIGPECEKGSTVSFILVRSLYNSALSHLYNPSPSLLTKTSSSVTLILQFGRTTFCGGGYFSDFPAKFSHGFSFLKFG